MNFAPLTFDPNVVWERKSYAGHQPEIMVSLGTPGARTLATRVAEPVNGPLMFEHPLVRLGRPVSWLDYSYVMETGRELTEDQRVLPADRDFSRIEFPSAHLHEIEVVSRRTCHAEWTKQNKWRGRPTAFTQFNLDTLIDWRDGVFLGKLTIRELANRAGVSEPAAARFAHGETLWYI